MSDEVPGLPELHRMLVRIDKRLDDSALERRTDQVELAKRLDDMERRAAERERNYVRLDVYSAQQQTDAVQLRAWEAEMHSLGKRLEEHKATTKETFDKLDERKRMDRGLVLTGLVMPLILLLIAALVMPGAS